LIHSATIDILGMNTSQSNPTNTTDYRILVEASRVDQIWGTGLAADSPDAENPDHWPGLNL
jgi:predicted NAD-dependent protein-ADP-ribosyltransferase YbiA (DUF1768 family)